MGLDGRSLSKTVHAQNGHPSCRGADKAHKVADGSGFSCAIGPQKTKNLSPLHLKGEVEYALALAVVLGETLHVDHVVH